MEENTNGRNNEEKRKMKRNSKKKVKGKQKKRKKGQKKGRRETNLYSCKGLRYVPIFYSSLVVS